MADGYSDDPAGRRPRSQDETDPWLEFGDELGGTVSDKGLGNLTLTDTNGMDNLIGFDCSDAAALATFLKGLSLKRIFPKAAGWS